MNRRTPVIVSAVRTPIGKFGGTLAAIPSVELGATAIREAVGRVGIVVKQRNVVAALGGKGMHVMERLRPAEEVVAVKRRVLRVRFKRVLRFRLVIEQRHVVAARRGEGGDGHRRGAAADRRHGEL